MFEKKFFEIAANAANLRDDERIFRVGCCGIRSDGIIVIGYNGPVMLGDMGDTIRHSFPAAHAEIRCSKKLNKGSTVFVARVRRDNFEYAMARPCPACMNVLLSKNVKKIFYTIDNKSYGNIVVKSSRIFLETVHQL